MSEPAMGASSAIDLASSADMRSGSRRPWNGEICQASLPSQDCTWVRPCTVASVRTESGACLYCTKVRSIEPKPPMNRILPSAFSVLIASILSSPPRAAAFFAINSSAVMACAEKAANNPAAPNNVIQDLSMKPSRCARLRQSGELTPAGGVGYRAKVTDGNRSRQSGTETIGKNVIVNDRPGSRASEKRSLILRVEQYRYGAAEIVGRDQIGSAIAVHIRHGDGRRIAAREIGLLRGE